MKKNATKCLRAFCAHKILRDFEAPSPGSAKLRFADRAKALVRRHYGVKKNAIARITRKCKAFPGYRKPKVFAMNRRFKS